MSSSRASGWRRSMRAGRPLWDASSSYIAALRLAGGPVVERAPFEPADVNAFDTVIGTWTVSDGVLVPTGSAGGVFGELTWDLLKLELRGAIGANGHIGAAVLLSPANPGAGHSGLRASRRRRRRLTCGGVGNRCRDCVSPVAGDRRGERADDEVFADAVRCTCGEIAVSVPREDPGAGRCAIMAGGASITVLRVRGIDMYRLPFQTSRFEGFREHIESCHGVERYDAGSAAEPLADLWSRLGGSIATVMMPAASDADREAVFGPVASALAVPLLEDPAEVACDGRQFRDRALAPASSRRNPSTSWKKWGCAWSDASCALGSHSSIARGSGP